MRGRILSLFALSLIAISMIFLVSAILPIANGQVSDVAWVRGSSSNGNGVWSPENFGWFYYDLDEGVGSESLSVDVDGRLAKEGHIIYKSAVISSDFEYEPWGSYNSIPFLGKLYLAGYPESSLTEKISSLENGGLREVLLDIAEVHTISSDKPLPLQDGYQLAVNEISNSSDEVNIVLVKNRDVVDVKVVSVGDTYTYKKDEIPIILVHVANAMCTGDSGIVEVDGIFQVSDEPTIELVQGERLDNMILSDLSENGLELRTNKDLNLKRDSTIPLVGDQLSLVVLDSPELIYYPQGGIFDYGVHEIRGPVYTENSTLPVFNPITREPMGQIKARWNYENFSGFYFDPENQLGREGLIINNLTGRYIEPYRYRVQDKFRIGVSGMEYSSFVQPSEFEFKPWGSYYVVGFLGELWFAGYGENTSEDIGHINIMAQQQIDQLLLDLNEIITVEAGRSLPLRDGYELALLSVSNDEAFVQLKKKGETIESSILKPNSTYIYKADLGDVSDLPVISVHVQNVFEDEGPRGNGRMTVDGIFQISDKNYLPIDPGNDFGEFQIIPSSSRFLYLVNPDEISLDRDSSQGLWYGMSFRVADNDTLRYYLYAPQYVVPSPKLLGIDYPDDIPSSSEANFTMGVKAGEIQKVSVDILGPDKRTVFSREITEQKAGSGDSWLFGWRWNASELHLSDDGSPVLDAGQPVPALLYVTPSSEPVKVWVMFDKSGRITTMMDGQISYYISPYGLGLINSNLSYNSMLQNETARSEYIKIEPGKSTLKFFEFINGSARLGSANHTIEGPLESIEPHVERVPAEQGKYEIRLMIANAVNTLLVTDAFYFQVTEPEVRGAIVGSGKAISGEPLSVRLEVPRSGGEKSVNISYDPSVVEATGASGPCNTPSYIDPVNGLIRVVMPVNCSSTNITFKALSLGDRANATTKLDVTDAKGFKPKSVENGSIFVAAKDVEETDAGKTDADMTQKSTAPTFAAALAALTLMAFAWRRRRG